MYQFDSVMQSIEMLTMTTDHEEEVKWHSFAEQKDDSPVATTTDHEKEMKWHYSFADQEDDSLVESMRLMAEMLLSMHVSALKQLISPNKRRKHTYDTRA